MGSFGMLLMSLAMLGQLVCEASVMVLQLTLQATTQASKLCGPTFASCCVIISMPQCVRQRF